MQGGGENKSRALLALGSYGNAFRVDLFPYRRARAGTLLVICDCLYVGSLNIPGKPNGSQST